jgi:hypothetical protein
METEISKRLILIHWIKCLDKNCTISWNNPVPFFVGATLWPGPSDRYTRVKPIMCEDLYKETYFFSIFSILASLLRISKIMRDVISIRIIE